MCADNPPYSTELPKAARCTAMCLPLLWDELIRGEDKHFNYELKRVPFVLSQTALVRCDQCTILQKEPRAGGDGFRSNALASEHSLCSADMISRCKINGSISQRHKKKCFQDFCSGGGRGKSSKIKSSMWFLLNPHWIKYHLQSTHISAGSPPISLTFMMLKGERCPTFPQHSFFCWLALILLFAPHLPPAMFWQSANVAKPNGSFCGWHLALNLLKGSQKAWRVKTCGW